MSDKFQSILLGGAVTGLVLSFLPVIHPFLSCLFCLFIPLAGFLSIWHYVNTNGERIEAGPAAGVGALAGLVAAVVSGVIGWALTSAGLAPDMQDFMRDFLESRGMDPDEVDTATQQSPAATAVGFVVNIVVSAVLGAAGGAIGGSVFGKKKE